MLSHFLISLIFTTSFPSGIVFLNSNPDIVVRKLAILFHVGGASAVMRIAKIIMLFILINSTDPYPFNDEWSLILIN